MNPTRSGDTEDEADDRLFQFRASGRRKGLQESFHEVHDAPYNFVSEDSIRQAEWKSLIEIEGLGAERECETRYVNSAPSPRQTISRAW
jgi:hypothetical protein